MAERLCVYVYV